MIIAQPNVENSVLFDVLPTGWCGARLAEVSRGGYRGGVRVQAPRSALAIASAFGLGTGGCSLSIR